MENQNAQITNDLLNITAIMMKDPEGASVLGVWHCMEAIAAARPDNAVCLVPGVPMSVPEIASCFHFPVTLVEKAVAWLQTLGRLTLAGGLLQFTGCRKKTAEGLTPKDEARQKRIREQTRLRVAKCRELKKEKEKVEDAPAENASRDVEEDKTLQKTDVVMQNVTTCVTPDVTQVVTHDVTPDVTGVVTQHVTQNDITDININNNNNKYALYADMLISHKPVSKYQRILDAWNKLPLRKFTGLIPLLQKKLQYLLERYGEETIVKTVERIGSSDFLLGKKAGRTWTVTLGWLLEPGNFAKVLAGNYFDKPNAGGADWQPGERCPFYLPGEGTEAFTPEEEKEAVRNLFLPTTPAQKKAARLLGLGDRGCAA
ncbi:MAG: hypothetical protein IJQ91_05270 [Acidaminococcaceae bacterium]|nr:hypothetical protein [Acidaminococcaceae bacterium]